MLFMTKLLKYNTSTGCNVTQYLCCILLLCITFNFQLAFTKQRKYALNIKALRKLLTYMHILSCGKQSEEGSQDPSRSSHCLWC